MTAVCRSAAMSRIDDVHIIHLPRHVRADGEVVVAEAATSVPFTIARLFVLRAPQGADRGKHAHRLCSQFIICVHGAVEVIVDDAVMRKSFALDRSNLALLVPPMIWNTVVFRGANSIVAVLCDRPYEADDYISDYAAFASQKKGTSV
jgi:UDP-2-acetamido-3-amino-2,3-dideoxy-glucuronate N-acetyltransferase